MEEQPTKEMVRAADMLRTDLVEWDDTLITNELELGDSNLQTGFKAFSSNNIKLGRGNTWRWNRTAHFNRMEITNGITASISKMNSRSKVVGDPPPDYKVWIFELFRDRSEEPLFYVWCERGNHLSVSQYSFLRPFVSDSLAKELNWSD